MMNNLLRVFEINKEYDGRHILRRKALIFAVKITELSEELVKNYKAFNVADQISRSSTSIGANASEADRGVSTADFIYKLSISQKEACETKYWLTLCFAKNYINEERYKELWGEAHELYLIIASSILTAKKMRYK